MKSLTHTHSVAVQSLVSDDDVDFLVRVLGAPYLKVDDVVSLWAVSVINEHFNGREIPEGSKPPEYESYGACLLLIDACEEKIQSRVPTGECQHILSNLDASDKIKIIRSLEGSQSEHVASEYNAHDIDVVFQYAYDSRVDLELMRILAKARSDFNLEPSKFEIASNAQQFWRDVLDVNQRAVTWQDLKNYSNIAVLRPENITF